MAFQNGVVGNFVISFTRDPRNDFGAFAEGYFHAASKLAEDLLSRTGFPDFDVYPVVFLYRHSLELYLKNIIYKAALLMAFEGFDNIDTKLYNTHDLIMLSKRATAILRSLFPYYQGLKQFSDTILRVSSKFSDIDADSFAYRYPIDRQGNHSTKPNQVVNLEALSRTMNDLLEGLDTLDFGLEVETSQAQEIYKLLKELG